MAVERVKEFTIDLGDLVKARLDSFVNSRKRIHAVEETAFQRSVVDNDLSYQEQLDYRKAQLTDEKAKTYPDIEFIDEVKTSISGLKKMVRYRKFRDGYFTLLTDLASGRKALEDHLEFLQDSLADEFLDREIKDELKDQYVKTVEAKRMQDRTIIDSQVAFYEKDRTAKSIDQAIDLVKSQLTKPDVQRDNVLRTSYEMQLATLEKERSEVQVEDKMTWMAINLISQDRKNPSLWKMETFSGFRDKAGTDMPVNIGGVRYASEQEYWQLTLDNYIQNDFGNEYVKENKGEAALIWNKMGMLPTTYLQNLITNNNIIRAHPELQEFQQVIASAIQDSITSALNLKAKDLSAKYYLDKPDIATEKDYQKAKSELENLKILFGADYSLSPEIQALETKLIEKRIKTTQEILSVVGDVMADPEAYGESPGITWEQAFEKYAPGATVEIPAKTFLEKKPIEAAKETIEAGKKMPELMKERKRLEEEIEETKKRIEEAEKAPPAPAPTPPAPTAGATHRIVSGENLTVIAKRYGTTIGAIMEANKGNPAIRSRDLIIAGRTINIPTAKAVAPPPAPKPTPLPAPTPPAPKPTPKPTPPPPAPTPRPPADIGKKFQALYGRPPKQWEFYSDRPTGIMWQFKDKVWIKK